MAFLLRSRSFVGALGCLCALVAVWLSPASARADEPVPYGPPEGQVLLPELDPEPHSCPEAPEELSAAEEQYSDEVIELRATRVDLAGICRALADRSDLEAERLWWSVAQLVEAEGQRAVSNAKLSELVEGLCAVPCPVSIDSDEGGELASAELASHVDASGQAVKVALYLLLGVAVGGFVAYVLASAVRRGT